MVRRIAAGNAAAVGGRDWAEELESFDDLHATAGLRRDIFRRLAPQVAAEAQRCAA